MTYAETLDFLYTKLPMFSRVGSSAFKKDLTNTIILLEHLENPHQKFKSIHVGGTNGKGSVSHMMASVLQTAGYKTGLYTSPHIHDFRERIKINGVLADEFFVIEFVEKISGLIDQVKPSFFEITVAMAFDYFAQKKVDIAVIEVGLGGRLDSTNVIDPVLSVITNIGFDHMNMLGDSLSEIAFEKSGIIKENTPVVVGERNAESDEVFLQAAALHDSDILFAEDIYATTNYQWKQNHLIVEVQNQLIQNYHQFKLDLSGIYQIKNVCTVLSAFDVLYDKGFIIKDDIIKEGLANVVTNTGLTGRWQVIHKEPLIVLEVAHNEDGIQQMLKHLNELTFQNLHIIFGIVKDKEIRAILQLFPPQAKYYFTQADIPRALPASELKSIADNLNLTGEVFTNVNEALQNVLSVAGKEDVIIVCGSIFLIAEVDIEKITMSLL
ncbi:MAG: bifunctional folylpolyglutamate synthase/dihydrofolate synthase [Bacteroidota bacterium]|nr:bifunctional folylpolyglutamate synthase/dihydrofolate synthase [Bacteroidota bacterium]